MMTKAFCHLSSHHFVIAGPLRRSAQRSLHSPDAESNASHTRSERRSVTTGDVPGRAVSTTSTPRLRHSNGPTGTNHGQRTHPPAPDGASAVDRRAPGLRHVLDRRRRSARPGAGRWSGIRDGRRVVTGQFEHAEWEGFRFYDLIFPLFLFLVGAVLPFSLGEARPGGSRAAYWRIGRRTRPAVRARAAVQQRASVRLGEPPGGRRAPADRRLLRDRGGAHPEHQHRRPGRSRRGDLAGLLGPAGERRRRPEAPPATTRKRATSPAGSIATTCPERSWSPTTARRQRGPALDDPGRGDDPARRPGRGLAADRTAGPGRRSPGSRGAGSWR